MIAQAVCTNCWQLFTHGQVHDEATDNCPKCQTGKRVSVTPLDLNPPSTGVQLNCLVCAQYKPWGIFDQTSGVSVCVECRDKARKV